MSNMRLDPVQNSSLADLAREMIRSAIFDGRIAPDERLTIEHIAAELGISRTPVREALKALETDGIVKLLPNRGAIVQRYDKPEIQDRYTVRSVLEGLAGELACRNKASFLTTQLQHNCDQLETSIAETNLDDLHAVGKLVLLNSEFHSLILDASRSQTAMRTLATLQMPMVYRVYTWKSRERALVSLEFHKEIVAAFSKNDPLLVRKLMEDHICDARDFLVADETSN